MTNHEPLRCQVDGCPNEVTCFVHDSQDAPFLTCGQHNDHDCECGQCVNVCDTYSLICLMSDKDDEIAELDTEIEAKNRELFEAKLRIKMLEESLVLAQSEPRQTNIETMIVSDHGAIGIDLE